MGASPVPMFDLARASAGPTASLSDRDLRRVAEYIGAEVGIQLPPSKRSLVEGRLGKRLRRLGFCDYTSYLDYALDAEEGNAERIHLVDAITTNKTDFFREPQHFHYLVEQALPELERARGLAGPRELSVWSAGCSSGEEPYTLAMVLCEAAEQRPRRRFSILATDISRRALETAVRGIYPEQRVAPVPLLLRRKYLLRSRNRMEGLVRMGPRLCERTRFGQLNLMARNFGLERQMSVIFCRNVMIYFSPADRQQLARRFAAQLVPGGYLFIGHSESLNGLDTGLKQLSAAVYRKAETSSRKS
ncbi:MAG: CheR family methyltransferase [Gammaproteobacteria bacterium]